MKKLQNKKGFTLVEMIVVLAIIAILIALLAPNVARLIKNAQTTSDNAKAKTIMNASMSYGTEAVGDGQSVAIPTSGIVFGTNGADGFGVVLAPGSDNAFVDVYYPSSGGASTAPNRLMGGSGDDFLPSNTLKGNDGAVVYISPEGAVMGVVYYNGSGVIKSVAGVCPAGANTSGAEFTTSALRQKYKISATDGKITVL